MNRLNILKLVLCFGAFYYIIGGIAHYFGLTIFPWFDGNLYVPYQDSIIAFVCLILVMLFLTVAQDPMKNIDVLKVIIASVFLASVFSILITWKIDFVAIGAPAKKMQTITEGIIGFIYTGILLGLYPYKPKNFN